METGLLLVCKDSSAFGDGVCAGLTPSDLSWVGLREEANKVSINFDAAIYLLDVVLEAT